MGRRMSWLQRRGAVYRFRRAVPARLRPIINQREIVRSLRTTDPEKAKRWGVAVAAEVDRLFAEAEAATKNPSSRVYKALQDDTADRLRRPRIEATPPEEGDQADPPPVHQRATKVRLFLAGIAARLLNCNSQRHHAERPATGVTRAGPNRGAVWGFPKDRHWRTTTPRQVKGLLIANGPS
jgi:Domain of unknown function (DUF6538)